MLKFVWQLVLVVVVGVLLLVFFLPSSAVKAGIAQLKAGNGTAHGAAELIPNLQGKGGDFQINLQGLVERLPYVITLDEGGCGGKVLATIGARVDPSGNATTKITLEDLAPAISNGVWVNVHQGENALAPSIACGKMEIDVSKLNQAGGNTTVPTNTAPTNVTNPDSSGTGDTIMFDWIWRDIGTGTGAGGFPDAGVGPAQPDSYNNYTHPRKY